MLTKEQIQGAIVMCVQNLAGCGSRQQQIPIDAKIEAYLFVLTGKKYRVGDLAARVYKIADIEYREEGCKILVDDDELDRIGLQADNDGRMSFKTEFQ